MASEVSKRAMLDLLRNVEWGFDRDCCPTCGPSPSKKHAPGCGLKLAIWRLEYEIMPHHGSSVRIPHSVQTGATPAFL